MVFHPAQLYDGVEVGVGLQASVVVGDRGCIISVKGILFQNYHAQFEVMEGLPRLKDALHSRLSKFLIDATVVHHDDCVKQLDNVGCIVDFE